jgi:hypothetical protein
VGNPYPSAIDLASGSITWDQFEPTAWFWNQTANNYYAYPTGGAGTHSQYAPQEQGFYVHINSLFSGNSTLTLTNTSRVHNTEPFLKKDANLRNAFLMTVLSSVNSYSDKISVHFNSNATAGYDPGFDAYKLEGLHEAPQLYTLIGDTHVTCNSLPFDKKNMVILMDFSCGLPGGYTLVADSLGTFDSDISVSLEDLKLNSTQDLKINRVYNFTYDTLDNASRFLLHFDNPNLGVNGTANIRPVEIYSFGSSVYIRSADGKMLSGDVIIYDMIGRELYRGKLSGESVNRITPAVPEIGRAHV